METAEKLDECQYLTFVLDSELFALDITRVREVLEFHEVTKVPRMPAYMRGVINLRGAVVPVLDLKQKFGMGATAQTVDTCVIITEVDLEGEQVVIGALADAVQEVFDLDPSQVEPPPKIGTRLDTTFIQGMGKKDEQFVILLDIDRVFSADEVLAIAEVPGGGTAASEAVPATT